MKHLYILLIILLLSACQKKNCYVCTDAFTPDGFPFAQSREEFAVCDMTEKQIEEYIKEGNKTQYVYKNGKYELAGTTVRTCTKK